MLDKFRFNAILYRVWGFLSKSQVTLIVISSSIRASPSLTMAVFSGSLIARIVCSGTTKDKRCVVSHANYYN